MDRHSRSFACEEEKVVEHVLLILQSHGHALVPNGFSILDFGCGSGRIVYEFRKRGYSAFGVDLEPHSPDVQQQLVEKTLVDSEETVFSRIDPADYRIPFSDETFDFVFSNEVLEHVMDHKRAFSEIRRVMKQDGISLHIFPPKFAPLEVHTHVPLAGVFQQYAYLVFWAFCGIRNKFQQDMTFLHTARSNHKWLKANTNYKSKKELKNVATAYFQKVMYLEREYIKLSPGRPGRYYAVLRLMPLLEETYSGLRKRVLFLMGRKEHHVAGSTSAVTR